jgi:hypothetical protein
VLCILRRSAILELIVCIFHPIAVVLAWIDLARRDNLGSGKLPPPTEIAAISLSGRCE